jgi:hypothetical protein
MKVVFWATKKGVAIAKEFKSKFSAKISNVSLKRKRLSCDNVLI